MRFITESQLLLGRLYRMPAPTISPQRELPFDQPVRADNFVTQATAAAAMPLQIPAGAVPLGTGAMADCYVMPAPVTPPSLEELQATVHRFEEAFSAIESILNANPTMPQRDAIRELLHRV